MIHPCPIPRCALEIHLSLMMVLMGVTLLAIGDKVVSYPWVALFVAAGLAQFLGLYSGHQILHRWLAFMCSWVLLAFCSILIFAQDYGVAGMVAFPALSEFYIFAMLRGARWNG